MPPPAEGGITRRDAIEITRKHDGKFPWTYLGKPLSEILKPLGITVDDFIKICDRFTNKKIFLLDSRGNLVKDDLGNLLKREYPEDNGLL